MQKLQLNIDKSVIIKKMTQILQLFFVYLAYELNHRLFFYAIIFIARLLLLSMLKYMHID